MEKYLVCIETFESSSLEYLYERLDSPEPAGSDASILCAAVAIQCESRRAAEEILTEAVFNLQCTYLPFLGDGKLNPLVPGKPEKIDEDYYMYYGSRAKVFWYESAVQIWGVSGIAAALTQYNKWLSSPDERRDIPQNRECVLLRDCEEQSRARRVVLQAIELEPLPPTGQPNEGDADAPEPPATKPVESEQMAKERVACEAWIEGLTWDQVVERLKERFGDSAGVDGVTLWAKKHWNREHPDEPFPKRKPGRRKKS